MKITFRILEWRLIILIILIQPFSNHTLKSQTPSPLPIEFLFGNEQLYFQMVTKKSFTPDGKFAFFSIATYSAPYDDYQNNRYIIIPVQFSYKFWNGFGIMAGTDINSVSGFSPIIGPQFNYVSKKFLAVTVVSYFLNQDNNLKLFGLYEYQPTLNENLISYNRLQVLYNFSADNGTHKQSYIYFRTGLKRKQFVFGLGSNIEQSGPSKKFEDNYGIFTRWEF